MKEEFLRTASLIGEEKVEKLTHARVLVFGVGGVGGFTVEALARSGVGYFHLVDFDTVAKSNKKALMIYDHARLSQVLFLIF